MSVEDENLTATSTESHDILSIFFICYYMSLWGPTYAWVCHHTHTHAHLVTPFNDCLQTRAATVHKYLCIRMFLSIGEEKWAFFSLGWHRTKIIIIKNYIVVRRFSEEYLIYASVDGDMSWLPSFLSPRMQNKDDVKQQQKVVVDAFSMIKICSQTKGNALGLMAMDIILDKYCRTKRGTPVNWRHVVRICRFLSHRDWKQSRNEQKSLFGHSSSISSSK